MDFLEYDLLLFFFSIQELKNVFEPDFVFLLKSKSRRVHAPKLPKRSF